MAVPVMTEISNIIDTDFFKPSLNLRQNENTKPFNLCCIANANKEFLYLKGYDVLAKAWKHFDNDIQLHIAGRSTRSKRMQSMFSNFKNVILQNVSFNQLDKNGYLTYNVIGSGSGYYIHFDRLPGEDGMWRFDNVFLLRNIVKYKYDDWKPGFVTKFELKSSIDDPWGCLPVNTIVGGAYAENNLLITALQKLEDVDAESTMKKILPAWYDRTAFMEVGRK